MVLDREEAIRHGNERALSPLRGRLERWPEMQYRVAYLTWQEENVIVSAYQISLLREID
jgi:hypothetical protein